MAETFTYEGKEYTIDELNKILGQHEKARERAKKYRQEYDPAKAKKQRDARMARLQADPELWALYQKEQKKNREKRSLMLKATQAFATANRKAFEDFCAKTKGFKNAQLPAEG
jgi:hypothetical protein